jgi:DNA polymerase elongation subunit (family B)
MTKKRKLAVLDLEVYRNYFLIGIKSVDTGKSVCFERSEWQDFDAAALVSLLKTYTIVTFNGNRFDLPILKGALAGLTAGTLKQMCDDIIVNNIKVWDIERKYNLPQCPFIDHIDLIEVAIGKASLKIYGGRLHSKRMQDLPIEPTATITNEQRLVLSEYCLNDLQTTIDLYTELSAQIELREKMTVEYGVDLRSKSDAQIAEAVIKKQIEAIKGERIYRPSYPSDYSFKYEAPAYVKFDHPLLQNALKVFQSVTFTISEKGDVVEPEEVGKLKFDIGSSTYQLGIGGIHSCEKSVSHQADHEFFLFDRDVTSYYPNIILSQRLFPSHLGDDFLGVYKSIVQRRIAAKKAKDKVTDLALKITINGSFGKFGSKWSVLYGPKLLIQTTVTGQLALLMLVDRLEARNIRVVSANTDGIVMKCGRSQREQMLSIFDQWEKETGFQTEETEYSALYSRDINNYIAIKPDGSFKTKGEYAETSLSKTPATHICSRALVDYLQLGIPVEKTILASTDIRDFVSVRGVTGGGVKDGEFLGKAVRWYYAKNQSGYISYSKNGNKVPKTDGAKPLMTLPENLPGDIDYDWYVAETKSMLKDLGL